MNETVFTPADARLRAQVIRADVGRYRRDSDAFVSVEVLKRWSLDYLLETADILDALAGQAETSE